MQRRRESTRKLGHEGQWMRGGSSGWLLSCLAFIIGLTTWSGCASVSSYTTAKTTPKGKMRYSLAGGVALYQPTDASPELTTKPAVEAMIRRGFGDRFDLGIKYASLINFGIDFKIAFINGAKFAMALGAYGGYFTHGPTGSQMSGPEVMIPLYISVHPTTWLGIYVVPKAVVRLPLSKSGMYANYDATSLYYGGTGGLQIGSPNFGVYLEGSLLLSPSFNVANELTSGASLYFSPK